MSDTLFMSDTLCPIHFYVRYFMSNTLFVWYFMSDTLFMSSTLSMNDSIYVRYIPGPISSYVRYTLYVWYFMSDTVVMSSTLLFNYSIYVRCTSGPIGSYVRYILYVLLHVQYYLSDTHLCPIYSFYDGCILDVRCILCVWCYLFPMHCMHDTRSLFHTFYVRKTQRQLTISKYGCKE